MQTCSQLHAALRILMSLKNINREVAYTRSIHICQNLARLTVYELIGGQILLPNEEEGAPLRPSPLVLLPVVDEPSEVPWQRSQRSGQPS